MELDFEKIKELIPQRFPFIMIDRVLEIEPGKHAVAVKNVSGNDIFFLGHFPEKAIMPGAAIIEAMAQTAIILFATPPLIPPYQGETQGGCKAPLLPWLCQGKVFTSCCSRRPVKDKGG